MLSSVQDWVYGSSQSVRSHFMYSYGKITLHFPNFGSLCTIHVLFSIACHSPQSLDHILQSTTDGLRRLRNPAASRLCSSTHAVPAYQDSPRHFRNQNASCPRSSDVEHRNGFSRILVSSKQGLHAKCTTDNRMTLAFVQIAPKPRRMLPSEILTARVAAVPVCCDLPTSRFPLLGYIQGSTFQQNPPKKPSMPPSLRKRVPTYPHPKRTEAVRRRHVVKTSKSQSQSSIGYFPFCVWALGRHGRGWRTLKKHGKCGLAFEKRLGMHAVSERPSAYMVGISMAVLGSVGSWKWE